MLGYHYEDFQRYFAGAFVKLPDGQVAELRGIVAKPATFQFRTKSATIQADMSEVKWEDVVPYNLGYVNAGTDNDLFYVTKKPGRNTAKGVSTATLQINGAIVTGVCVNLAAIPVHEIAHRLFFPEFVSYPSAVEMLRDPKQKAIGYALSAEVAIALDPGAKNGLLLLIDEQIVGRKKWDGGGSRGPLGGGWEFSVPHAIDVANRLGVK